MCRLLAFAVAALVIGGCHSTATLRENTDEATRRLLEVRPRADVSNIEAGLWLSESDRLEAKTGLEDSLIHSSGWLRAQLPLLLRLGLLTAADAAELGSVTGLGNAAQFAAFAVPETGKFFVKPGSESVATCVHEIAHIVSFRMGYMDGWPVLLRGQTLDACWLDLDALLAAWALDEAVAELTEEVAMLQAEGGDAREYWAREIPLGRRLADVSITGPITITYPDGSVFQLDTGTHVREASSIARRLLNFVYRASQRTVTHVEDFPALPDGTIDLDLAFAQSWHEFSFTTRQVLFPDADHDRSRFAERFRDSELDVASAARIGAFVLHEFAMRQAHQDPLQRRGQQFLPLEDWEAASNRLRDFEDDQLVQDESGALLWIVEWRTAEGAAWFADLYSENGPEADVRLDDTRVIINFGGFEGADEVLAALVD